MEERRKPPESPRQESGRRNFDTIWANCGNTAQYLIGRVHQLGGDVDRDFRDGDAWDKWGQGTFKAKTATELESLLLTPVGQITLFNITIDGIHEFVIEKHPDSSAILHQGYQGGHVGSYNAFWWANVGELDDRRMIAHEGESINRLRDIYGKSQFIDEDQLATFTGLLITFLLATPQTTDSRNAWNALPFLPGGWEELETYTVLAAVWKVYVPEDVLEALSDTGEEKSPTTAVLKEAWENREK